MSVPNELICVVEDDQSFRRGLRRLFKAAGYVAETFASAEEYLARQVFDGPVCIILDVRMPGLDGPGLQEAVRERGGGEQIVFITGHIDVPTCTEAMKKGAVDFLLKPFEGKRLIEAVDRALDRSRDFLQRRTEHREARTRIDKLTPREFDVLRLVICGMLNKQIAVELHTAETTVKVHRGRVMEKLRLSSVPDLVRLSQRAGIAPADHVEGIQSQSFTYVGNEGFRLAQ